MAVELEDIVYPRRKILEMTPLTNAPNIFVAEFRP